MKYLKEKNMAVATLENQTKERSEITVKDSWNLDRMYSSWTGQLSNI